MKIGTMTFHWATNYGAVLQAYALREYLTGAGYSTEIIDYCPRLVWMKQRFDAFRKGDFDFFRQEKSLKKFRNDYLKLSQKHYSSHRELINASMDYDCMIAGSDQIWNESFTLRGEGKTTLSYYLDFASENTKRIAYAVSFGFSSPSDEYRKEVEAELNKFSRISVREEDGRDIVKSFGLESTVVCDPTVLLSKDQYSELAKRSKEAGRAVFAYILRSNQVDAWSCARYIGDKYGLTITPGRFTRTMEEWLSSIYSAEIVITNSFHAVMLSIIMNRPFIAFLTEGSGMNSRITTLLDYVGLSSRLVNRYSEDTVEQMIRENIDWTSVNERVSELQATGVDFLKRSLDQDA